MNRATTNVNFIAFQRLEPMLEREYPRKVVVFHEGRLVATDDRYGEALRHARKKTSGKRFYVTRAGPYDKDLICAC